MDVVLTITAPIFFLIFLGFVAVRVNLVSKEALAGMSRLVLYFALPALVFTKLSTTDLASMVDVQYITAYAIGGLCSFFITVLMSRVILKSSYNDAGVQAIGATMANSAFVGFPILIQFFDHVPTQAFAMALMVENIILLPVALTFIESTRGGTDSQGLKTLGTIAKRVMSNPIICAVFLGVLFSAFGLSLPSVLDISLEMLAKASAPVALFVIGGSLVGISLKGSINDISLVVCSKLLVYPLIVFGVLQMMPDLSEELKISALLFAAMPMFSTYPIICSKYGKRSFCASTLLVTTLASFFTLSILLRILS
ncbi:AEC family transporter [Marinomonas mediterranea]|jgi:Predicted permeases|uniref:Auxin Efflux Carrier n=1 Tax=Marinomonas mediterranea (strain ATCC 700492 / JCM 21426 / NBRC 103028 / MMB-1) TaxID=717774 RepID=F2K366_MARM1|nr:AEC family transporter [Marinomonas mediterranea]ADZ90119.1 Auxin Efflux Carrier [Marinomonas mediterranea MMB-1]WCN08184.1 AEC family transporter [Marinomonas mediterranea]WCN12251.1 AEC family transporter [Marinomonas mediterranea]WCN16324.1 AEC family transporter [Marinomonas mediterranea MMB-1]